LAAPEEFRIEEIDRSGWLDSKRKAESIAFLKLVIRRSDDRIVGAAALSQEADVLINEITMVLHAGWTKAELKKQILAYPSPAGELTRFWK
jgi:glutathione reductase (NADPH)